MILTRWRTGICVNTKTGEVFKMTDTTEPAGAARFTAVSYPNMPTSTTTPAPAPLSLEDRLAALEAVVHTLAINVSGPHWDRGGWLDRVGAQLKAGAKKIP